MLRVKVYGAGSIGTHLSHAARQLGWRVTVYDPDQQALDRMKTLLYPSRYGKWDPAIQLYDRDPWPVDPFDLILVGTPPEWHLPIAMEALARSPLGILVEKPVCTPDLRLAKQVHEAAQSSGIPVFVGYNHVVSKVVRAAEGLLADRCVGQVHTIDAEFREHWEGIFRAHPWLNGPEDSYLGFSEKGGGAASEHSHALNLWQHFAHLLGFGRVHRIDALLSYQRDGRAEYDSICCVNVETEKGLVGRIVQDVVTKPPLKCLRVQGSTGCLEIRIGYRANVDAIIVRRPRKAKQVLEFSKTRPDEFIQELRHIATHLDPSSRPSPISLERGLDTMLHVAAVQLAHRHGVKATIDYTQGYTLAAIGLAGSSHITRPEPNHHGPHMPPIIRNGTRLSRSSARSTSAT